MITPELSDRIGYEVSQYAQPANFNPLMTSARSFYETVVGSGRFSHVSLYGLTTEWGQSIVFILLNESHETLLKTLQPSVTDAYTELVFEAAKIGVRMGIYFEYWPGDEQTIEHTKKGLARRLGKITLAGAELEFLWEYFFTSYSS